MKLTFTKMHGAGNDFVVFDNRREEIDLTEPQIKWICDRRFGIGADGILLLNPSPDSDHEARMVYFNADGSRGEMCGNGARCFTRFALAHQLGQEGKLRFLTDAGSITARADGDDYTIQMTPPADLELNVEVALAAGREIVHYVDTGVPHVVKFVNDLSRVAIREEGAELRHHPRFAPRGGNVNFVHVAEAGTIRIRTYERGVEDETLACGTGVTATAIVSHLMHNLPAPIKVRVAGGDTLSVNFEKKGDQFLNLTLSGPARTVYQGVVDLP